VRLSVVSGSGKEAVVAMFGPGDFFDQGCMASPALRMGTATAATQSTLLAIQKEQLPRVLHAEHELPDHFTAYMLAHNIRVEEDLINSSTAAKNAWHGRCCFWRATERPLNLLAKVSQETLASMVGTTRSRVNFFMNKFRKLGFIEYNGRI